ncbi:MAG: MBL fold metallo-hydrolase [Clostridia bacterium]|nr:MBL fold metallo-hydrolase [Clostridia bacterium]
MKSFTHQGILNGGSSLYSKEYKLLFTGDTLFKGTYGRCDLPTRR